MFIIGNGESRLGINIEDLPGTKIGCNAILRDYNVRHLVCVDRKMVREALTKNYNNDSFIYTRKDWFSDFKDSKNIRLVPELQYVGSDRCDEPIHWGSGPYAVLLGAILSRKMVQPEKLHLIGFDLYGSKDNKVNNVYKDTDNYDLAYKRAVDPRYWIYQIAKVFEHNKDIEFVVYNKKDWCVPKSWKKHNVRFDNVDNLVYNINQTDEKPCLKITQQKMQLEKQ